MSRHLCGRHGYVRVKNYTPAGYCPKCEQEMERWWKREQVHRASLPWCSHAWPENPGGMYHCPECGTMILGEKHKAGQDQLSSS